MSLRYALLALLTAQPMTGYDLAKSFHSSIGHVWHAPDSQIYPELRRMEAEGLVNGASVARNTRATNATKRIYTVSEAGISAFREWMTVPIEYTRERDPAALRAAYFEWTDSDSVRRELAAHIAHWQELREQWQWQSDAIRDRDHPITIKRLELNPPSEWDRIIAFKLYAYESLLAQADQQIAWARRGLRLVDELDRASLDAKD